VAFGEAFLAGWSKNLRPTAGLVELITDVASDHRLAIVSNTNDRCLVPSVLDSQGITAAFEQVTLSVEMGIRKPLWQIFEVTLERMGLTATDAVFVGDSYEADYLGARAAGLHSLLIDPDDRADVPASHRLRTIQDLRAALSPTL